MSIKFHPLVQKTKLELERKDKQKSVSWEEWRKYSGEFLPIYTEPKLRSRALKFMDDLIKKLEKNGHSIKFEYQRCHIEMYGQLTEINLRQKYFRKRIKDSSGYSSDTYEKSNKLEFQVGSHARKGWIDKETKSLEDYLETIYNYVDKDSKEWAEFRKRQKIQKERRDAERKQEEEKARLLAIEEEKFYKLLGDAENHQKANMIRDYLKEYEAKFKVDNSKDIRLEEYIDWAYGKANEIDPLV